MKKITLEVTQADIDRGLPYSSGFSPVARAFHRAGFLDVVVNDEHARIIRCAKGDTRIKVMIDAKSKSAAKEIMRQVLHKDWRWIEILAVKK